MTTQLDRRLTPARPDLADETLRGIVDAARYVAGEPRRVVVPSAPLRREPRFDAGLDTEAVLGEAVRVYETQEGFAWTQLGTDGYVGYLPEEALGPDAPPPTERVVALRTFLYPGPDLKLPALGHLSMGAGVTAIETRGAYSRLSTGGWVFAAHLAPADRHEPDFVRVAERFFGTPYLWGGRTSLGIDCSGLVQLSLAMAGLAAPRDTDLQRAALGSPVETGTGLSGLRRGDLVFWSGHVGIMLDADGLLHANGHHMAVAAEPLREAAERIGLGSDGPVVSVQRLARLGA